MSSVFSFSKSNLAFIGNCFLIFFYLIFGFSLISLYIPPHVLWISEIATLLIPVFVFFNCLITLFLFLFRKGSIIKWIGTAFFLLSFFYFFTLFRISRINEITDPNCDFTVLSYNVSGYNIAHELGFKENLSRIISGKNTDFVCLQEFFPEKGGPFLETLYPYQVVSAKKNVVGVTIFSKYPIIRSGLVFEGRSDFNKGIYADVLIKGKVLRIVSVHFESNNLKKGNPFFPLKKVLRNAYWLKQTSEIRSTQVRKLNAFIDSTAIPLIVAGDFNETPYSYVYQNVKKKLNNAFEEKGNGFGFTFLPNKAFLRIDHQFFEPRKLSIKNFYTYDTIHISDHVPILGCYRFSD
ncbi:MAG: endonuclease/exonuclease/phosphatase family protein [Sporocytophaga sp.]|uniref:endonuclease/exonuclease/phosphatase family protein n=1 Tax=Sporocytophaga sp. TaxID=2231183 RepID=UPI001B24C3E0|nr:endonuclease/exonuclease/phosphatase family protein [Sporocytophaga sp.]MBO9703225.1 endonuclease/exonuclease/phosphatase family protein [Sporocytophaga sp.]